MSSLTLQMPLFRPELEAASETVGEVAYVRITDPKTFKTTRLYALEYQVAKAMDGRRSLSEIAAHIASAQGVTPSLSDLERFVDHLVAQGLVVEGLGLTPQLFGEGLGETTHTEVESPGLAIPPAPLGQTASLSEPPPQGAYQRPSGTRPLDDREAPPRPQQQALEGTDTTLSPADAVTAGAYALVTEELDLKKSAGRDGLGWEGTEPTDPRGRDSLPPGPASGTPTEPDPPGVTSIDVRVAAAQSRRKKSLWRRVFSPWVAFALLTLGLAFAAYRRVGPFGGSGLPLVTGRTLESAPHPVVAAQAATEVHPARQSFLSANSSGPLASILDSNQTVASGDIVATLRMTDDETEQLDQAREALKQANARIASLNAERLSLAQRRRELQAQQQPQTGLPAKERRKLLRSIARRLVQGDRRDRILRVGLVEARSEHARAVTALDSLEHRLAAYLVRAPFAGVTGEPRVAIGVHTRAGQPLIALEDRLALTVSFPCTEPNAFEMGAPVAVMVEEPEGRGREIPGIVDQLIPLANAGAERMGHVVVALKDEEARLSTRPPHVFHLVTGRADHAFWVPSQALGPQPADNSAHFSAWVIQGRVAQQLGVELVDKRMDGSWVQLKDGSEPPHQPLIVDCVQGMAALTPRGPVKLKDEGPQSGPLSH